MSVAKMVKENVVVSILIVELLYNIVAGITNLSLPLIIVMLGGNGVEVAVASFTLNTMFMIFSIIFGRLSDLSGKRKIFIELSMVFLISSTLIFLLTLISKYVILIYLASTLLGLASASFSAIIILLAVETSRIKLSTASRIVNKISLFAGIGWSIGLIIAGITSIDSLGNAIIIAFIANVTSLFITIKFLPETPITIERQQVIIPSPKPWIIDKARMIYSFIVQLPKLGDLYNLLRLLKMCFVRTIPLYLFAMLIAFTAIGLFFTQLPVFLKITIEMDDFMIFLAYALSSITSTLTYLLTPKLIDSLSERKLLGLILCLRGLIFSIPIYLSIFNSLILAIILFITIGASWAPISVTMNSIMIKMAEPHRRAERVSQLNAMISLGLMIGSGLSGLVVMLGFEAVFIISATMILISGTIILLALKID